MPNPLLTAAVQEAYAVAPVDMVLLATLELRHPDFTEPIRVVRNHPDIATWLAMGDADVQAVLDGLSEEARDLVGLVARLEDSAPVDPGAMVAWIAMGFEVDLPPVDTEPVPEVVLTMDNVGREVTDALTAAAISQDRVQITFRPYASTDIQGPQWDPPMTFTLTEVEADELQVRGRARLLNFSRKKFPALEYTAARFPALAT